MDLRDLRAPTTLTQDLEEIAEKTASYVEAMSENPQHGKQTFTAPALAMTKRQYRLSWERRLKALEREAR